MIAAVMNQLKALQQRERKYMLVTLHVVFYYGELFYICHIVGGYHLCCLVLLVLCNGFFMLHLFSLKVLCRMSYWMSCILSAFLNTPNNRLMYSLCSNLASDLMKLCGETKTRNKVSYVYSA